MKRVRSLFIAICIFLALAVVCGAFGAHALEEKLTESQRSVWETANRYHFYHALGALILLLIALHRPSRYFLMAIRLHLAGILLFSGSLYLLATQDILGADLSWLGPVTPIGGIAFIAGWLIAIPGFKDKT